MLEFGKMILYLTNENMRVIEGIQLRWDACGNESNFENDEE